MTKATLSSSSQQQQQQQQQQHYTVNALEAKLGVHLLSPPCDSKRDETLADCMGRFASYCLDSETNIFATVTLPILHEHLEDGLVGELQGGNENAAIYRVALQPNSDGGPVSKLFQAFLQVYPHYQSTLTIERLQEYMLQMCNDPRRQHDDARTYSQLGNVMLIVSHSSSERPLLGQVRHIDHMEPNLQVCCYMSEACPATIIYDLVEEPSIANCEELLEFWQDDHGNVPTMIRNVMIEWQDVPLGTQHPPQLSFFHFWNSLNHHLQHFGKLYQHVSQVLAVQQCTPGTTLIVKGNQVHAGPPSHTPRMFAFCIGIPDDEDSEEEGAGNAASTTSPATAAAAAPKAIADGEIQYNPVLLHVDLCCILFALMMQERDDEEYDRVVVNDTNGDTTDDIISSAKRYLLHMLPAMILEYPHETYARLLDDRREPLRTWLGELVAVVAVVDNVVAAGITADDNDNRNNNSKNNNTRCKNTPATTLKDNTRIQQLIDQAVTSKAIFACPALEDQQPSISNHKAKQQRRQKRGTRRAAKNK